MGSNINLLKLAQMLGMGPPKQGQGQGFGLADLAPQSTPPNQPTHGYTIAEKEPEVVTAPGVYFPSEKGEVLSPENYNEKAGLTNLIPRQKGGPVTPSTSLFGLREDGTQKGTGFFGELKRPDGKDSTEISIGVNFDGKETLIPSLVPTLTQDEINHLLNGGKPTDVIIQKAVEHARGRIDKGLNPFAQEGEQTAPPQNGTSMSLIPRQFGGKVNPSWGITQEPSTLYPGGTTFRLPGSEGFLTAGAPTEADERARQGVLDSSIQTPGVAPSGSYYDAHPEEKATGFPPQPMTSAPTPSPNLSSFMSPPPAFKENKRSSMFASDQKTAFDQKWQPYQDMMKKMGGMPLFPRATGIKVSPDPMEGLTEEEKRRYLLSSKGVEVPFDPLATTPPASIAPTQPDEMSQLRSAMTLGPPNPAGDEAARTNIGDTLLSPELEARNRWDQPNYGANRLADIQKTNPNAISVSPGFEKTYYEAHPEERFIDAAAEANKPLIDSYQKLIEEAKMKSQGFGLGINPKAGRLMQAEAVKALPELASGLEKVIATNQAEREKYFNASRDTYGYGKGVGIFNKKTGIPVPGTTPIPKPGKAPTRKSEDIFDPSTGQTYRQDFEWGDGKWEPSGGKRLIGGPAPKADQGLKTGKLNTIRSLLDEDYASQLGTDVKDIQKKLSSTQKEAYNRIVAFAEKHAKTMEPRAALDQATKDWHSTFGQKQDKYVTGKTYLDAQGRNAKYLGEGKWELIK